MPGREQARAEARFRTGQAGVDGAATEEAVDPSQLEQHQAREALYRGRTWLGREALSWLLWKSEGTEPLCTVDKQSLSVVFTGKLLLRAAQGEVTEVALKGVAAPYAKLVRHAEQLGLLVHGARLKLTWGEQVYEVALDAEHFDVRSAKLPTLLEEEEAERLTERLELAARLSTLVDALIGEFVAVRTSPRWKRTAAELRAWMQEA